MVIASFEDGKSSSLASFEGGFFSPFANGEIILGFKQSSPVLFMAVKSCGDANDVEMFFRVKTLLDLF
jgi:hypothetical protein